MLRVGLTGGIGAGKSAVAARLVACGAVLVDADRLAREVVEPGTDGLTAVVAEFGSDVVGAAGDLDRARLAEIVFADPGARGRLEAIVHPLVRRRTAELVAAAPLDAVVVNDVPLLVEAGLAATYHLVVVVEADPGTRRARLVERGMAPEAAAARIAAQATDERRRAAADALIDNSGSRDDLHASVDALWRGRLVPYERGLRLRQPCPLPEPPRPVAPDAAWSGHFRRVAGRIRAELGDRVERVDHVGSTAVPGLVARDVLDVQLVVADEVAVDRVAESLAAAGLPALPGDRRDDWSDGPAHGGADPGQPVRLWLWPAGSPRWRAALTVRDWLRADPAARDEYAGVKRDAAGSAEYGEATARWLTGAGGRASSWADAHGWQPDQA
ncbi:MAG: dephospho-CoA kinase [Actinocatenispora sp.]